jgi:F-type H+-transporting ATPase subunit epsilon
MKLEIVTPEKIIFTGNVSSVTLPGRNGLFTIRKGHAPIIASLSEGLMHYISELNSYEVVIGSGVVEAKNNKVVLCVETAEKK